MSEKLHHQKSTRWKRLPATDRQRAFMDAASIQYTDETTRGEASKLITEFQEDAPHIFSEEAFQY